MFAFLKSSADFSRGRAHQAMRPPISATHPRPRHEDRSPGNRTTAQRESRSALPWTVLYLGVEVNHNPPSARAPLTSHPRTTLNVVHTPLEASQAGRCALRSNPLSWLPRSSHQLVYVVVVTGAILSLIREGRLVCTGEVRSRRLIAHLANFRQVPTYRHVDTYKLKKHLARATAFATTQNATRSGGTRPPANNSGLDKPNLQHSAARRNGCRRIVAPEGAGSSSVGHPRGSRIDKPETRKEKETRGDTPIGGCA